jgi:hypothetical protein
MIERRLSVSARAPDGRANTSPGSIAAVCTSEMRRGDDDSDVITQPLVV